MEEVESGKEVKNFSRDQIWKTWSRAILEEGRKEEGRRPWLVQHPGPAYTTPRMDPPYHTPHLFAARRPAHALPMGVWVPRPTRALARWVRPALPRCLPPPPRALSAPGVPLGRRRRSCHAHTTTLFSHPGKTGASLFQFCCTRPLAHAHFRGDTSQKAVSTPPGYTLVTCGGAHRTSIGAPSGVSREQAITTSVVIGIIGDKWKK